MGMVQVGRWLDQMISETFSNLHSSMINRKETGSKTLPISNTELHPKAVKVPYFSQNQGHLHSKQGAGPEDCMQTVGRASPRVCRARRCVCASSHMDLITKCHQRRVHGRAPSCKSDPGSWVGSQHAGFARWGSCNFNGRKTTHTPGAPPVLSPSFVFLWKSNVRAAAPAWLFSSRPPRAPERTHSSYIMRARGPRAPYITAQHRQLPKYIRLRTWSAAGRGRESCSRYTPVCPHQCYVQIGRSIIDAAINSREFSYIIKTVKSANSEK